MSQELVHVLKEQKINNFFKEIKTELYIFSKKLKT